MYCDIFLSKQISGNDVDGAESLLHSVLRFFRGNMACSFSEAVTVKLFCFPDVLASGAFVSPQNWFRIFLIF